jgi:hypothetical protein
MTRFIHLLAWAVAFFLPAIPTSADSPSGEPVASGVPRLSTDPAPHLGRLPGFTIVHHDFVVTNTGNAPLEIRHVRLSCGCTTVSNWTKRVESGMTGKIPMQFDTTSLPEDVSKWLQVVSNDPTNPITTIEFKATVWKPLVVMPTSVIVNFGDESTTNPIGKVYLTNTTDQPMELAVARVGNPSFRAEIKSIVPGKVFKLEVGASTWPKGTNLSFPVILSTTSTNVPEIVVKATAIIPPPITVSPARLLVPPEVPSEPKHLEISIKNNTPEQLSLSSPRINNLPGVEARLEELVPGRRFKAVVTFPAGFQMRTNPPVAYLELKTSDTNRPSLFFPILPAPPETGQPQNMDMLNRSR